MSKHKYTPQSCIYIIQNTKTKHVYIGQAQDVRARWIAHKSSLRLGKHGNVHLQRAWNKYGENVFKFSVLEYCTVDQLNEREQHYLNTHIPNGICYNVAKDVIAPMRGIKDSPETLEKKRKAQLGKVLSPEHRLKISLAQKGRTLSEEKKQHLSKINTGKKRNLTPEQREALSQKMKGNTYSKGKFPSEETRKKLSAARTGEKNVNFGRVFSEEHRRRLSESHMGNKHTEETKRKIRENHASKKKPSTDSGT